MFWVVGRFTVLVKEQVVRKVGGSEGSSKDWGSHQRREAIKGVSTMSEVLSSTSTKPKQSKERGVGTRKSKFEARRCLPFLGPCRKAAKETARNKGLSGKAERSLHIRDQGTMKSRDGVDRRCAEWWEGGESELDIATLKPGLLMVMVEGYGGERRGDQAPSLSFPWQLVFFHSGSQVPSKSGTQTLPDPPPHSVQWDEDTPS